MKSLSVALVAAGALAGASLAQDSVDTASTASEETVEALAAVSEAGVKLTTGSVAVPLAGSAAAAGAGASAADTIATDLWDSANEPLAVADEVVLQADPPPNVPATPPADETETDPDTAANAPE